MIILKLLLFIQTSWANPFPDSALKNAVGSFESHQSVVQDLREWGKKNPEQIPRIVDGDGPERKKFISLFNDWLKERNLPLIDTNSKIKISKTCFIGFVPDPNCFSGFEIEDGKNKFCFPCMAGHNLMVLGVISPNEKLTPLENKEGAIYEHQKGNQKVGAGKK